LRPPLAASGTSGGSPPSRLLAAPPATTPPATTRPPSAQGRRLVVPAGWKPASLSRPGGRPRAAGRFPSQGPSRRLPTCGETGTEADALGGRQWTRVGGALADVPDPRRKRGVRHPWGLVLVVIAAALLAGQQRTRAIGRWVREHAEPRGEALAPPGG